MDAIPVVDIAPLVAGGDAAAEAAVAADIGRACRGIGFFYVRGHGAGDGLLADLDAAARRFFALPEPVKAGIAMSRGGRAWRGWFPLGGELTSGRPDAKEGLYFGSEHGPDHPRVAAGWPLHGPNLWPADVPELRPAVEVWMAAVSRAAAALSRGVALALGLDAGWFDRHWTAEPTILFRIFRYPPAAGTADDAWGVGEHSDYGFLTLLAQDGCGGLEVKTPAGWTAAPPVPGTLVCNLGDMLEALTAGRFRSTPHRVRNAGSRDRLSFPLFYDPDMAAEIRPLPIAAAGPAGPAPARWDGLAPADLAGPYGDYLLRKVGKVFPALGSKVLERTRAPLALSDRRRLVRPANGDTLQPRRAR